MDRPNQNDCQTSAEALNDISTLLIQSWPNMRKRLIHVNALQTECCMPISHIQLLSMLAQVDALSITQISERFGIAKPNITPMIDRMIAEGLVTRMRSNHDKRIVSVVICEKGRERLDEIHDQLCHVLLEWMSTLAEGEIFELRDALRTVARLVCQRETI